MPKYYRVKVDGNEAYIVDDENSLLPPDICFSIGKKLTETAETPTFLYIGKKFDRSREGQWKIGISKDPDRRAKELNLRIFHQVKCHSWGYASAQNIESALHKIFRIVGKHVDGEWYNLSRYDALYIKHKLDISRFYPQYPDDDLIYVVGLLEVADRWFDNAPTSPDDFTQVQGLFDRMIHSELNNPEIWKIIKQSKTPLLSAIYTHFSNERFFLNPVTIYLADLYKHRWQEKGHAEFVHYFSTLYEQKILEAIVWV